MHFSVCSSSSTHSAGSDFSILCRVRTPRPHVALHSLQSDQGDRMQGMVSADTQRRGPGVSSTNDWTDQSASVTILSLNTFSDMRRLTALRHHALLHLGHLSPAHGAVNRGHLHHALASPHPQAAGDAAGVPLGPLCHHAAAGRWTSDKENRISGSGIHTAQEETQRCHYSPLSCFNFSRVTFKNCFVFILFFQHVFPFGHRETSNEERVSFVKQCIKSVKV